MPLPSIPTMATLWLAMTSFGQCLPCGQLKTKIELE
jgi:hypothetical protein